MSCNLIAITPERFSDTLVDQAVELCMTEKKKLIVLLIEDPTTIKKAESAFKQSSPVGNSKAIAESLRSHQQFLLQEDLANIKEKAEKANIQYEELRKDGDFEQKVLESVAKLTPDVLFVCKMNTKTALSRFLQGSAVQQLQKNCPCKVVII